MDFKDRLREEIEFNGLLGKEIAAKVGGGGGGRPNMAQAGGQNPAGIPDAVAAVKDALDGMIS